MDEEKKGRSGSQKKADDALLKALEKRSSFTQKRKAAAYEKVQTHKSVRFNKETDKELLLFLEENKGNFNFNQFVKTKLADEIRNRKAKERAKVLKIISGLEEEGKNEDEDEDV